MQAFTHLSGLALILASTAVASGWERSDEALSLLQLRAASDPDTDTTNFGKEGFATAVVTDNNLGGLGPVHQSGESLTFSGITTVNGNKVDLVIRNTSEYKANAPSKNGMVGEIGIINIMAGSEVSLHCTFVDHVTGAPMKVSRFEFAIFDLDTGTAGSATESATIGPISDYYVTADTEVTVEHDGAKAYTFTATQHGTGGDNPSQPKHLSPLQSKRAVTAELIGVDSFDLTFGATSGSAGRNFMFGGESSLAEERDEERDPCEGFVEFDFGASEVVENNLGGQGPENGAEVIRYSKLAKLASGTWVDLVVKTEGAYVPFNADMNGVSGSCGQINMKNSTKVRYMFHFYETGTDTSITLERFFFSVLDVDKTKVGGEELKIGNSEWTAKGFKTYYLSEGTELEMSMTPDGRNTFTATEKGTAEDNPTEPLNLTTTQADRSITFYFPDPVDQLIFHYEVSGETWTGRNFLFAGVTNVACPNLR